MIPPPPLSWMTMMRLRKRWDCRKHNAEDLDEQKIPYNQEHIVAILAGYTMNQELELH
jgi:hypothetical protein